MVARRIIRYERGRGRAAAAAKSVLRSLIIYALLQIIFSCKDQGDEMDGHVARTGKLRKASTVLFRMLGKIKRGF